jgi:hypothetical protein
MAPPADPAALAIPAATIGQDAPDDRAADDGSGDPSRADAPGFAAITSSAGAGAAVLGRPELRARRRSVFRTRGAPGGRAVLRCWCAVLRRWRAVLRLPVELRGRGGLLHDPALRELVHEVLEIRHELVERDLPVAHARVRARHLLLHHRLHILRRDTVKEAEAHEHHVQFLRVQDAVAVDVPRAERRFRLGVVIRVRAGLRHGAARLHRTRGHDVPRGLGGGCETTHRRVAVWTLSKKSPARARGCEAADYRDYEEIVPKPPGVGKTSYVPGPALS